MGPRASQGAVDLLGAFVGVARVTASDGTVEVVARRVHPQYEGPRRARFVTAMANHRSGLAQDDNARMPKQAPPWHRRALSPAHEAPLSERDIEQLQALLDQVPAPLEPLDVSMLDGFLCGVLVQPKLVTTSRWLPHVCDADGRALPASFDAVCLQALVLRRHRELDVAIALRQWFDPWVFELSDDAAAAPSEDDATAGPDAVYPWVAGFATALELFPALMQTRAEALTEPLALLYRHLDPQDLEDADALLEEIDTLEPPADLSVAVEGLVRATLLLADITRPNQIVSGSTSTAQRKMR